MCGKYLCLSEAYTQHFFRFVQQMLAGSRTVLATCLYAAGLWWDAADIYVSTIGGIFAFIMSSSIICQLLLLFFASDAQ